jgi:hypothetical protein
MDSDHHELWAMDDGMDELAQIGFSFASLATGA